MKKAKITLTFLLLSLIIVINGCGGKLTTISWTEKEIGQMKQDDETEQGKQDVPKKLSPVVRYTW